MDNTTRLSTMLFLFYTNTFHIVLAFAVSVVFGRSVTYCWLLVDWCGYSSSSRPAVSSPICWLLKWLISFHIRKTSTSALTSNRACSFRQWPSAIRIHTGEVKL